MTLIASKYLIRTFYIVGILSRRVSSTASTTTTTQTESQSEMSSPTVAKFEYENGTHSIAFVTIPDETSAKQLANMLIVEKLAACVNLLPQITSIYEWEGKINEDTEVLMMIKTRTTRIDELSKFVREHHPYSVAEVISIPIENGNNPYLEWISKTVPEKKIGK